MKLVHIVTVPDSLIFLKGQCSFMVEQGHDVTVISDPDPRLIAFARAERCEACTTPHARSHRSQILSHSFALS